MSRIYRNKITKECKKSCVEFLDKSGKCKDMYIYRIGNNQDIAKIKKYAKENDFDVLDLIHSIKMEKEQWTKYYQGCFVPLSSANIYEYEKLFIDIDIPLLENYHIFEALKSSGIANYQVVESASGNIHLYINVKKFNNKKKYKETIKLIGDYLQSHNIEIDTCSIKPLQKVWLEGFRVIQKHNFTSKEYSTTTKAELQSCFDIEKLLYKRGFRVQRDKGDKSLKYAMHIIKKELFKTYSGKLELSNLEQRYIIPQYTFTRALQRLSSTGSIEYKSIRGVKGHIQVTYCNENLLNECIDRQMTRSQNFIYINVIYRFGFYLKFFRNTIVLVFSKLCKYIDKNDNKGNIFISLFLLFQNTSGLLSGSSPNHQAQTGYQLPTQEIKTGTRHSFLLKTLVKAKSKGTSPSQLYSLSRKLHSKMQQKTGDIYGLDQVDSVVNWVNKLQFHNKKC